MAAAFLIAFEQEEVIDKVAVGRVFQDRKNPLEKYNDSGIIKRYRLCREDILSLVDNLRDRLETPTNRSHAVPPVLQVFATLRYFATGGQQRLVGDDAGLSPPTMSRCIERVTDALLDNLSISFPADTTRIKHEFYKIAGFPNVVGAIDGTLIPIIAPSDDEHTYICRKGFHAINVQCVADANKKYVHTFYLTIIFSHYLAENECTCRYNCETYILSLLVNQTTLRRM